MVRHYRRPPGTRSYGNYTEESLAAALADIRSGKLSQRQAQTKHKIPRSTLKNKLTGVHTNHVGHPTVLSEEEEQMFLDHLLKLDEYSSPLSSFDLRCVVKMHLDSQNRKVKAFKNNFPGEDWALRFLRKHKELSGRVAYNIKFARARVSQEIINKYFDNLEVSSENVPPENKWNYDETNLVDDPGQKKVIVKRGRKYPERIIHSSKSATSVMFCGNAAGEVMPPYIVYKAEHMWVSWTQGGPSGARYNRSRSGWFDYVTFEDWFFKIALPRLKRQEGKKLLIGDNLISHFSLKVLQACEENDIAFCGSCWLHSSHTNLLMSLSLGQ